MATVDIMPACDEHLDECSLPAQAKRRRLEEGVPSNGANSTEPPQHKRPFWFVDGDIVFGVENHLFKIHRHRLKCSLIFSDMFELPQPAVIDNVDGRPFVGMAGDSAKDWIVALRWLYDPETFLSQPVTFDTLSGALRISTKYEIAALREWGVREMQSRWPPNLTKMGSNALPHAAESISLARECDIPEVLPAAFYALSVQRWNCNADGGRSHLVLSPADLRRLISGRESLQDILVRIILNPLLHEETSFSVCAQCEPRISEYWRTRLAPNATLPWGCWLLREFVQMSSGDDGFSNSLCATCAFHHETLVWSRIRRLIEAIPRIFLL